MTPLHPRYITEFWGRYIDWNLRRKGENGFLANTLAKFHCKTVFDACMGDGCDSIYLLKEGFDVTSNELDIHFIKKAQENARKNAVRLAITSNDWRKLSIRESFDAVICLGNSLTYLFKKRDQLTALKNFYNTLKENGILMIDQRNYDEMTYNKTEILQNPKQNFKYSRKYVYCGSSVSGYPVKISSKKVILEIADAVTGKKVHLSVYPFKNDELECLLQAAGFSKIEKFYDYHSEKSEKFDFIAFVAQKQPKSDFNPK